MERIKKSSHTISGTIGFAAKEIEIFIVVEIDHFKKTYQIKNEYESKDFSFVCKYSKDTDRNSMIQMKVAELVVEALEFVRKTLSI